MSWLPEVVVDANAGKVSHGSGGPGQLQVMSILTILRE